ncbi:hypothetical protein O3P69_006589 [Scylla paramamosain]|uniref:Uncharacterized protein n=1 Tax=Scylla paramamosain TaxID=85552 RepID=A0AAW0U3D9_SCYPA
MGRTAEMCLTQYADLSPQSHTYTHAISTSWRFLRVTGAGDKGELSYFVRPAAEYTVHLDLACPGRRGASWVTHATQPAVVEVVMPLRVNKIARKGRWQQREAYKMEREEDTSLQKK